MGVHTFKRGLDLPIAGEPEQVIHDGASVSEVAVVAADYIGMKPTMLVKVGDTVKRGQQLFEDKKSLGTFYTAPAAGTIKAVNRGDKRALITVVITLSEGELKNDPSADEVLSFESYQAKDIASYSREEVRDLLIESGMWSAFRTRPFSKVPSVTSDPDALFITAMDTNPLAPNVDLIVEEQKEQFSLGLSALAKLREGHIYLCSASDSAVEVGAHAGIAHEQFSGPHPAGTVGVHIHTLRPAHAGRVAWSIGYQDVIALGHLFGSGQLNVNRVVSLAGPQVKNPRLIRTRVGASVDELVAGELNENDSRCISGSVLSGRTAQGEEAGFLGRYHNQISVIEEYHDREFLGWMGPGQEKFSVINTFVSKLNKNKKFSFNSSTNGSHRAMVPIGVYEKVMPMDFMMTQLLRHVLVGNVEGAEQLGCLELDEEDLALSTFVCPCKNEYGTKLREILSVIEAEG